MKAALGYGRRDIRVEDVPNPAAPDPGQVRVKVRWCGICGADLHEYTAGPLAIDLVRRGGRAVIVAVFEQPSRLDFNRVLIYEKQVVGSERQANVAMISLNRPERLNALGREVCTALQEAWQAFEADSEARVAILTGKGRAFSAGADIKDMVATGKPGTGAWEASLSADPYGFGTVQKPVVAAINGFAFGGGCHLALGADIRIAAERASFSLAEINLALYGAGHLLVPQQVPLCILMELSLTGEAISARRALEVGLLNQVVPDGELMSAALHVAQRIASHSPLALRLTKQALRRAVQLPDEAYRMGEQVQAALNASADAKGIVS